MPPARVSVIMDCSGQESLVFASLADLLVRGQSDRVEAKQGADGAPRE